jgi:hypothetical protein
MIKSLDLSEGSKVCLSHLKYRHKLEDETKYSMYFVETTFNDYYKNEYLAKILVGYAKRLDENGADPEKIYGELLNELHKETNKIQDYSLDYIGDEVFENFIDKKLTEFFSELVITLGKYNWLVTWIGHGKLTEEKLLSQFTKFGERYEHRIINKYDLWYSEAIIEASERHLTKRAVTDPEMPTYFPPDYEIRPLDEPNDTSPPRYGHSLGERILNYHNDRTNFDINNEDDEINLR